MSTRFQSLDIFRGFTVAAMILVNNPGSESHVYTQLEHSFWNGCTFTDLIFPFFLFAVGNSMAFSFANSKGNFWIKLFKRSLLIFFIGVFLNAFPFFYYDQLNHLVAVSFSDYRFFGVLQRIALCYFFGSIIIFLLKDKGSALFCIILLLGYWALCMYLNPADPYSLKGWFGTSVEKFLIGENHMYKGEGVPFEPEGLMSLPAAIAQTIIGYLTGRYVLLKGKTNKMLQTLLIAGVIFIALGYLWSFSFPLNKKIWTSSYTVFTTGVALLFLSILIYAIEFKHLKGSLFKFFDAFGKNTLFIYIASTIIPKLINLSRMDGGKNDKGKNIYLTWWNWVYDQLFMPLFGDPRNSSLLLSICFILVFWGLAYWLNLKKIYIKI